MDEYPCFVVLSIMSILSHSDIVEVVVFKASNCRVKSSISAALSGGVMDELEDSHAIAAALVGSVCRDGASGDHFSVVG